MAASPKKGGTPDDIMAPAEMKPLLMLSKREPVSCAVGLTADKLGVVLLHKRMKPKKVLAELKNQAKKVSLNIELPLLRFGTAEVDTEIDSALVRFRINKEAPGMLAPKLRDHLKKAGFSKVEFVVDPSLEEEAEEDAAGAPAAAAETAPAPAAAPPDPAGLTRDLTAVVKRIQGVADPGQKAQFAKLAAAVQAALKAGDLAGAASSLASLQEALDAPGAQASPAPADAASATGTVAYAKARLAWLATRKRVVADTDKLAAALQAEYAEVPEGTQIMASYRARLAPVLDSLNETLADKLDEVMNAQDTQGRAALIGEVREIIASYQAFVAGDSLIADLDDNPFVPLQIGKTVTATLAALSASVR